MQYVAHQSHQQSHAYRYDQRYRGGLWAAPPAPAGVGSPSKASITMWRCPNPPPAPPIQYGIAAISTSPSPKASHTISSTHEQHRHTSPHSTRQPQIRPCHPHTPFSTCRTASLVGRVHDASPKSFPNIWQLAQHANQINHS